MGFQKPLLGIETVITRSSGSRGMSTSFYTELIKIDLEDKCKYPKRGKESLGREVSFKQWSVIWHTTTISFICAIKGKAIIKCYLGYASHSSVV